LVFGPCGCQIWCPHAVSSIPSTTGSAEAADKSQHHLLWPRGGISNLMLRVRRAAVAPYASHAAAMWTSPLGDPADPSPTKYAEAGLEPKTRQRRMSEPPCHERTGQSSFCHAHSCRGDFPGDCLWVHFFWGAPLGKMPIGKVRSERDISIRKQMKSKRPRAKRAAARFCQGPCKLQA
jgi:hypothetical protein